MSINEVIEYYGNLTQACYALGIAYQNFSRWKRVGYIPYKQQLRLEKMSQGKLVCDIEDPVILFNATKERKK